MATKTIPIEGDSTQLKTLKDGLLSATSSRVFNDLSGFNVRKDESTVSITVVGASGDLAKKKIFPALFALYYEDFLPKVCLILLLNIYFYVHLFLGIDSDISIRNNQRSRDVLI